MNGLLTLRPWHPTDGCFQTDLAEHILHHLVLMILPPFTRLKSIFSNMLLNFLIIASGADGRIMENVLFGTMMGSCFRYVHTISIALFYYFSIIKKSNFQHLIVKTTQNQMMKLIPWTYPDPPKDQDYSHGGRTIHDDPYMYYYHLDLQIFEYFTNQNH